MAYLPPRIEIYQILKALGATLETPLLPFCIMGPAYRVRDTVNEHEQFGSDYLGVKKTIVFSAVDPNNLLLKREGVAVDLFVYSKTTGGVILPDTEIIASSWDTQMAEAQVSAPINDVVTTVPFNLGDGGYGLNYTGTPNFYAIIDPAGANREIVLVTANSGAPGGVSGDLTVVRGQKNTVAVSHLATEVIQFCTADVYYDVATKTIGNLNTSFMATVKEGDIVYRKPYGSSSFDGATRAYVVNVDAFNRAISVDVNLGFVAGDSGPAVSSIIDTVAVNAGGVGYKLAEVLTVVQAGASGATLAVATLEDPELVVGSFTGPSTITLTPGTSPRYRAGDTVTTSGATAPANNGPFTVATCVANVITVTEITIVNEAVTAAVLHCLDSGPVDTVTVTTGGFGYSVASGLATTVAPLNGAGCTIDILTVESFGQNDFFNIFSDVVNVVGYVKPISPYESNFVPNDAVGDYQAQIVDNGVILGSGYVDRLGNVITDAVIQSTYTTYARTLNRSSRIVNVPMLITSIDDIETYLGEIRPENDLAYGTFLALSSQRAGYAIAVDSNDLVGYNAAMEKLKEINVYSLVPLTYTTDVFTTLKAHVDYMSGGQLSRWRVGVICNENLAREVKNIPFCIGTTVSHSSILNRYVFNNLQAAGSINPGDILRLEDVDTPEINGDYSVIAVDSSGPAGTIKSVDVSTTFYEVGDSYPILSIAYGPPDSVTFAASTGFVVGDLVYIDGAVNVLNDGWHVVRTVPTTAPWTYGLVAGTIDATQAGPGGTCTKSQNITGEVFYYNSPYAIAVMSKNFAVSVGDRRMWNIFPSTVVVEEPDTLPGYFAAAAFAGAVGALPGPLPYTESTVPTITKVYGSSDIMGYDHLNIVAEGGNTILYHAGVGSLPTIRDQLTTNMDNVLTQNISLVVNPDFISYTLKASLEPLKGKYNIDKDLLDTVKMTTVLVLNHFTKDIGGKRIIAFTDPIVSSQQDCVIVQSELSMATPAKVIQVMLNLTV